MLDFLKNVSLVNNEAPQASNRGRAKNELNPTNGAHLRLFKNGSIYPSLAAVTLFDLEFSEISGSNVANGFDVFSSKDYAAYPKNVDQHVAFIAVVSKDSPRVDVFGRYKSKSVIEQGSKTSGIAVFNALADSYDFEFGDKNYVDLIINTDLPMTTADGIYYIPKVVAKGKDKGKATYERRDNLVLYPLTIFNPNPIVDEEATEEVLAEDNNREISE